MPLSPRPQSKLDALKKAYSLFKAFSCADLTTDLAKTAFVKAFEFNYELSWKLLKAEAESRGVRTASPEDALRTALQLGLLSSEEPWLTMIGDRNTTAHTYSSEYLPDLITRMKEVHLPS